MSLERRLQFSMAVQAVLGTMLLAFGQNNGTLPLVAVLVAGVSLYFTDIRGWIRLGPWALNLACLAAFFFSVMDWSGYQRDSQLLAMSNLLIYLQFVLQFREKSTRYYWLLTLLSLLQVAVAAALSEGMLFGLVLLVYLFVALVTQSLFFMYRERQRWGATDSEPMLPAAASDHGQAIPGSGFAGQMLAPAERAAVGSGLLRQMATMGLASVILAMLIFVAVPRVGKTEWRGKGSAGSQRVVGFSPKVALGALGEVVQNPEEVMKIELIDPETGEAYPLIDEPLFRGAILTRYGGGEWWAERPSPFGAVPLRASDLSQVERPIMQRITVAPLDTDVLFSLHPWKSARASGQIFYDGQREALIRPRDRRRFPIEYELTATGLRGNRQNSIVLADASPRPRQLQEMLQWPSTPSSGRHPLAELRATAEQVVAELPVSDRVGRARALERFFLFGNRFQYSLQGVARDADLDPVEDFVTQHRVGHCEYFASGLAMMLRSIKIPARVIVGFKGGEWNPMGQFYLVRQWHAHTWVEVYLAPNHLEGHGVETLGAPEDREHGAWLRLDPTPGAEESGSVISAGDDVSVWRQVDEYSRHVWNKYVVGMNSQRQMESIYQPLVARTTDMFRSLLNRDGKFNPADWQWRGIQLRDWLDWRGALLTSAVMLTLAGLIRVGRWCARRLWVIYLRWRGMDRSLDRPELQFYRRYVELFENRGWRRAVGDTPFEFAQQNQGHLAATMPAAEVPALPPEIVAAFYRVRYGQQPLDQEQIQAMEHALGRLAATVPVRR